MLTKDDLLQMLGNDAFEMYERLNDYILDTYNVNPIWADGGKDWNFCVRYRRSGKTLCTLFFREQMLGVLFVFGKDERERFEAMRTELPEAITKQYDDMPVYHDGKWMMIEAGDCHLFTTITALLKIKKNPNRKVTMCGYCCDICKAYSANIKKADERVKLSEYWKRYYALEIPAEHIYCDGCRCGKKDAALVDPACPIRACVLKRKIEDCSQCEKYPCELFLSRKGMDYETAYGIEALSVADYENYLLAFDNKSRMDRKRSYNAPK